MAAGVGGWGVAKLYKCTFFQVVFFSKMNLQNTSSLRTFDSYSMFKRLEKSIQVKIGKLKYYQYSASDVTVPPLTKLELTVCGR